MSPQHLALHVRVESVQAWQEGAEQPVGAGLQALVRQINQERVTRVWRCATDSNDRKRVQAARGWRARML